MSPVTTAAPVAAAVAAAPITAAAVSGTWLAVELAGLAADSAAINQQLHLIFDESKVPGWHLALVDSLLWVLGYSR